MKQPPKWLTGILSTALIGVVTTVITVILPGEDDTLLKVIEKQNETITALRDIVLAEAK